MYKDYRLSRREAENLSPCSILDDVVFKIYDDCESLTDDVAVAVLAKNLDPILFCVFSAWMVRGDIMVGGVFYIFEKNCGQIIIAALKGFELLKTQVFADIIVKACQIFPRGIILNRHSAILEHLEGG